MDIKAKRKKIRETLLTTYREIEAMYDKTERLSKFYETMIDNFTDEEFAEWMGRLESGTECIYFVVPPFNKADFNDERLWDLGEELGIKWMERLVTRDAVTGKETTSVVEYLVLSLSVRRPNQHLVKKQSIAKNQNSVDDFSGQVTNKSKGGRISTPEARFMISKGLDVALTEFIKVRGGDDKAYQAAKRQITETGEFSMEPIMAMGTTPTINQTLRAILVGLHLEPEGLKGGKGAL